MIWPFSRKYATSTARDYNYELSNQDIEFIKELYPKVQEEQLVAIFNINISEVDPEKPIYIEINPIDYEREISYAIDYGDGIIETHHTPHTPESNLTHYYKNLGDYKVKVYGNSEFMETLYLSMSTTVKSITADISKYGALKRVYISNDDGQKDIKLYFENTLSSKLEILEIVNLTLNNINLSNSVNLEELILENVNIKNLDLTRNIKLKKIVLSSEVLNKLSLSSNVLLEYLWIYLPELFDLDLSNNINLKYFQASLCGFLLNEDNAIKFANSFHRLGGIVCFSGETNLMWIKDILESKGWGHMYGYWPGL